LPHAPLHEKIAAHAIFSKIEILDTEQVSTNSRKSKKPLHCIRSQWNKTRPQQQQKPQKILKHMETEQHTAKKTSK
jgi:hypothetical protein